MITENKTRIIRFSLIILAIVIVVFGAICITIKYEIEGEKNMPFNLGKIIVISSAVTTDKNSEVNNENNSEIISEEIPQEKYLWDEKIIQTNDVYIYIDKNENYKKDAVINKIKIENIQILEPVKIGKIQTYMPNSLDGELYKYIDDFLVNYSLTYNGALMDNKKTLEIGNQGGCICLSFANTEIGDYKSNEDEQIEQGAFILEKMNLSEENLKFLVAFDLIIDVGDKAYKGNIKLQLPVENLVGQKESHVELIHFDTVFKRCKVE